MKIAPELPGWGLRNRPVWVGGQSPCFIIGRRRSIPANPVPSGRGNPASRLSGMQIQFFAAAAAPMSPPSAPATGKHNQEGFCAVGVPLLDRVVSAVSVFDFAHLCVLQCDFHFAIHIVKCETLLIAGHELTVFFL